MQKNTIRYGWALSLAMLVNLLLLIAKETNHTFFHALTSLTSHHWISQGLIVVGVYFLCALCFTKTRTFGAYILALAILLSCGGILTWYLLHG